jgi:hypothetical protein
MGIPPIILCPLCRGSRNICRDQIGNALPAPTTWTAGGSGSDRPLGSSPCYRCLGAGYFKNPNDN